MKVDKIENVNASTFEPLVLSNSGPVAVEFMSYGCKHCHEMEPILQQVNEMLPLGETIFRVNTAVDAELTDQYAIEGTPTFVMFLDGREVGRSVGPDPEINTVLNAVTLPFESKVD